MTDRREPRTEADTAWLALYRAIEDSLGEPFEDREVEAVLDSFHRQGWVLVPEYRAGPQAEAAALREAPDQRLREALEDGLRPIRFSEADPSMVILRNCDTFEWRERVRAALATEGDPTAQERPLDVDVLAQALDSPGIFEDELGPERAYELAVDLVRAYSEAGK